MFIESIKESSLKPEFGILCQRLLALPSFDRTPFGLTWCVAEPQKSTTLFAHHDEEVFLILKGEGVMQIADEKQKISSGDVIHINPFSWHQLTNISQKESLVFISIHSFFSTQPSLPSAVTIFSPPPTPNGDLHLGHLAGPYIAGDVLKRYLVCRQIHVCHVSGSDDSQTHVSMCALLSHRSREEVIETYQNSMIKTFQQSSIDLDIFIRSQGEKLYERNIQRVFFALLQKGKIVKATCSIPYCGSCQQHLVEAYIEGRCCYCHEFMIGQCCESCGHITEAHEILDPKCRICKQEPIYVDEDLYVFSLENYRQQLEAFLKKSYLSKSQQKFIEAILSKPLKDFPVTLPFKEGLYTVADGFSQCFHPWFEMACRHLFFHEHNPRDENEEVVFFYGFDNSYYYSFLIPAVYLALDKKKYLPTCLITNEFYCLEDKKFSTSRNHTIVANNFLSKVDPDVLRLYLMMTRPENHATSFDFEGFTDFIRKIGIEGFEKWIKNLNAHLEKAEGVVTYDVAEWTDSQKKFYNYLNMATIEMEKFYHPHHFSPSNVAYKLFDIIRVSQNFLLANVHSENAFSKRDSFDLALSFTALKTFALLALPLAPNLGKTILNGFCQPCIWEKEVCIIQSGTSVCLMDTKPFSDTLRKLALQKECDFQV